MLHVEGGRVRGHGVAQAPRARHVGRGRARVSGEAVALGVDVIGFPFGPARGEEVP